MIGVACWIGRPASADLIDSMETQPVDVSSLPSPDPTPAKPKVQSFEDVEDIRKQYQVPRNLSETKVLGEASDPTPKPADADARHAELLACATPQVLQQVLNCETYRKAWFIIDVFSV